MTGDNPAPVRTMDQPNQQVDILLVSMPFGPLFQPSIGLSLLKETIAPLKLSTKILYLTMRLAERIGTSLYNRIANGEPYGDLVGEWIFANALFGDDQLDASAYIGDVLRRQSQMFTNRRAAPESYIQKILAVRGIVDSFLSDVLAEVVAYQPKIVGFTSVFQQHAASLALAKRIKTVSPDTTIIFGGANCEGAMGAEAIRQFSFVDAIVSGEGENVFRELVERIIAQKLYDDLRGVYTRKNVDLVSINGNYPDTISVRDMDALPIPDYSDYFEQLDKTRLDKLYPVHIMFETSRGCWWGERSHCTFCGLNGVTMTYRSKSADRAIQELAILTERYPDYPVFVVDNILDMKYFRDFIPMLCSKSWDLKLFYEVKANLSKDQLKLMHSAGITTIQPGIESLSSHVLKLMKKGVSGLQNIQLLKWCHELGIEVLWNIIWGFPGEAPDDYAYMEKMIPLLTHLNPPVGSGTIRLDRFSPNFDHAQEMGFVDVRPFLAYQYIYPVPVNALFNLAYHFDYSYVEPRDVGSYTTALAEMVTDWKNVNEESALFMIDTGSHAVIWDVRPIAAEALVILTDLERVLYVGCEAISTLRQLTQLAQSYVAGISQVEVEQLLGKLISRKLILKEGNSYLSLATYASREAPHPFILQQFYRALVAQATVAGAEITVQLPEAEIVTSDPSRSWFAADFINVNAQHLVIDRHGLVAYMNEKIIERQSMALPTPLSQFIGI